MSFCGRVLTPAANRLYGAWEKSPGNRMTEPRPKKLASPGQICRSADAIASGQGVCVPQKQNQLNRGVEVMPPPPPGTCLSGGGEGGRGSRGGGEGVQGGGVPPPLLGTYLVHREQKIYWATNHSAHGNVSLLVANKANSSLQVNSGFPHLIKTQQIQQSGTFTISCQLTVIMVNQN